MPFLQRKAQAGTHAGAAPPHLRAPLAGRLDALAVARGIGELPRQRHRSAARKAAESWTDKKPG
jgi:hypothetical protein